MPNHEPYDPAIFDSMKDQANNLRAIYIERARQHPEQRDYWLQKERDVQDEVYGIDARDRKQVEALRADFREIIGVPEQPFPTE